ncbi:hypothetical protein SAMN05216214_101120 [Atopomonas hussainii]|uniref:Uncharacterized protein n=1 Tax=Atopomonas hussainii TaxID=1429083 RepID=A0A1H7F5Q4_9GAMM|nr:hypothetical protein [Atopomonas hussainii]SEK21439.1 hypothetical protein SAMN05216214_101120 [Atopomonas hussainii]
MRLSLLALPFALLAHTANATDNACMIEGSFSMMGQTIAIKDCLQGAPNQPPEALRGTCSGLAQAPLAMGGQAGTVTYMAQCPQPAQGVCKNLAGSGQDAYYYQRSADDLNSLPASCSASGGQWQPAG